jgi:Na+/melibiose symporter-like transporter
LRGLLARGASAEPLSGLRPFRAGYWFGGFNGLTWMIGLGTPMLLLAERLGASAFQVGLASSFVFLLLPVQVVATIPLRRLGYRRQMVSGWLLRALFLLVPMALAGSAPETPQPWMASALVASVFGFCLFRAFGTAAHMPWFASILPGDLRGRFFATDQAITSVVGVATLLACASLFARWPGWQSFRIVYAVAVFGSLAAVFNLLRLPPAEPPDPLPLRALLGEARRLVLRPGPFRHYLVLCLAGSLVTSSLAAFTVYYLKVEAGLASSRILVFTAAQFAGQIAGTWSIRHWIDRLPRRRLFQLAQALVACVDLYWWLFVSGAALERGLLGAYFVFGAGIGIANATHFTYLPELTGEARRPLAIAVFTALLGLISGLAPMGWGLALGRSGPGAPPGLDVERFALFFAFGSVISGLLAWRFARLPEAGLR